MGLYRWQYEPQETLIIFVLIIDNWRLSFWFMQPVRQKTIPSAVHIRLSLLRRTLF
jgi:hypothetical protein